MPKYVKTILLALALLSCGPAYAKLDAGDVQMRLDSEFGRGAVITVSVDKSGKISQIIFGEGADKTAINARVADIDANHMNDKGSHELNQEISDEIAKLADDKSIEDLKQAEIRAKLIRAKEMSAPTDKQQKLDEAKDAKVEAMKKPDNKPRIVNETILYFGGANTENNNFVPLVLRPIGTSNPVLPQMESK